MLIINKEVVMLFEELIGLIIGLIRRVSMICTESYVDIDADTIRNEYYNNSQYEKNSTKRFKK